MARACAANVGRTFDPLADGMVEDEDLVGGFELRHQERVDVSDVVRKTVAEGEAPNLCPPLADNTEGVSGAHGADAGVVVGDLLILDGKSPVELYDVGICRAVLVAGAVAADDYVARPGRFDSGAGGIGSASCRGGLFWRTQGTLRLHH